MVAANQRLTAVETVFKALADRTRLRILALLRAGETCVCDVHESLGIPQPKASRHLAYLRRAGLVEARREGLWMHYRIAEPADPVLRTLLSTTKHCLEHVPSSARDRARLERKTGCCAPTGVVLHEPVLACCETQPAVAIGPASRRDLPAVRSLLAACGLPQEELETTLSGLLVARSGGQVVGSVGVEVCGESGLLRSAAVARESRRRGVGHALTRAALDLARARGVTRLYLLTETAGDFFSRFGFEAVDRSAIPSEVRQSVEFRGACPETAAAMTVRVR